MFAEWFRHLTTPAPAPLKRMGYLKELIAIEARHKRQQAAWADHLEACKKIILEAAAGVKPDRVTILGSGPLLDVPLGELADTFADVRLVDIFHMPGVEKRIAHLNNVQLVSADLTGLAEATYAHVNEGRQGPLPPPQADASMVAGSDLVVSLNLLTQLPLLPTGWVQENGAATDEAGLKAFARRIIEHHLQFLLSLPGRVALITETERVISDGTAATSSISPRVTRCTLPSRRTRCWQRPMLSWPWMCTTFSRSLQAWTERPASPRTSSGRTPSS